MVSQPEALAQFDQGRELRLAAEDRLLDDAGERLAVQDQAVRAVLVEAYLGTDGAGEQAPGRPASG